MLCGTNTKPKSNASTEFVLRDEKSSLWGCSCVMRDEHDLVLCTKIAVLSLSFATIGLRLQASTVQRDGKHSTPYLVQLYFVDKAI